jgi:hypothetical protein
MGAEALTLMGFFLSIRGLSKEELTREKGK